MVVLGLLALGMMAWPRFDWWRRARFANELAGYAERSADGVAAAAVRRLAEEGLPAVDALVRLAGSERPAVTAAAQNALLDELASWDVSYRAIGDAERLARQLGVLAESMRVRCEQFDRSAWPWADRMALEIVARGDRVGAAEAARLLKVCDALLAASPTLGAGGRRAPVGRAQVAATEAATARMKSAAPMADGNAAAMPQVAAVAAGGGSASDLAVVREEKAWADAGNTLRADVGAVERAMAPAILPEAPREDFPVTRDGVGASAAARESLAAQALPAPPASPAVVDVPSPQQARVNLRRYRRATDAELVAQLQRSLPYEALAIRQVLRERGVRSDECGGDVPGTTAEAAHELIERLSKLPAANARQQLRRLVQDADPEVRLKALAVLATSGDPQLDEIVRRRAVEDNDPRVAELATRIMRGTPR
jgi:hypothetical protein